MARRETGTSDFVIFITEPNNHPALEVLRSAGEVRMGQHARRFTEAELIEQLQDCDAVMITSRDRITRAVIEGCPRLKIISKYGARPENVDLQAAEERGIQVLCTPWSNPDSVAEHMILLTLAILRQLGELRAHLRAGGWRGNIGLGTELKGKTVGLIGLGNVGSTVAERLSGFRVRLLASDPYIPREKADKYGAELVDQETLLRESDVVSLHAAVTPETTKFIGEAQFRQMKPTSIFINTARGALVDEAALLRALTEGWISAAGIDVYDVEPLPPDHPLLKLDNVIATPHMAAYTREAMDRERGWAAEDVVRALHGQPPLHSA